MQSVRHGAAIEFARLIAELEDAVNAKNDLAKVICIDCRCAFDSFALNPTKYAKELERDQTIKVKLGHNISAERCGNNEQRLWLLTLRWEKDKKGNDRPLIVLQHVEIIV
ncbi:MAG: hypothetical protein K2O18_14575 [Oscillospiraceae bacterium]|nr:hypothetical protein [Oscillospiraceae bacterium]